MWSPSGIVCQGGAGAGMESNPEGEGCNDGEIRQDQGICCGGLASKIGGLGVSGNPAEGLGIKGLVGPAAESLLPLIQTCVTFMLQLDAFVTNFHVPA